MTFRQHDLMADSHELCLARCTLAEVWGNRKIPISAEAQPSAEVAHVKCSLYESALLFDFLGREVHDVGKHGAL